MVTFFVLLNINIQLKISKIYLWFICETFIVATLMISTTQLNSAEYQKPLIHNKLQAMHLTSTSIFKVKHEITTSMLLIDFI